MLELHYLLFKRKIPLMIAYEGWDAAGKGGNITRVTRYMNPLGYYVVPVSAPTEHEKQYHYLRRFIKRFPTGGDIAIFDRSWYGRVLVERVENYCSEPELAAGIWRDQRDGGGFCQLLRRRDREVLAGDQQGRTAQAVPAAG